MNDLARGWAVIVRKAGESGPAAIVEQWIGMDDWSHDFTDDDGAKLEPADAARYMLAKFKERYSAGGMIFLLAGPDHDLEVDNL